MSSYDDLRRSNYRADGARKATQQEAREARDLSRDSYRPDALRKASEQEAAELGKDETWEAEQVDAFTKIAKNYIVE